ncbi:DEAD/DEAH box helicase [Paenibacillus thermotolerans]|uniref:DEAD/DEAH box helicase n=1 Tax=Paenibacillus thermotolerans TaxID=3027807 RepID=UPI002367AF0E|nr:MULTISPECIES: DEAD/DEAH box helicase [unclassified Paenibacillus]
MPTASRNTHTVEYLAEQIVKLGLFVPSVDDSGDSASGSLRGMWKPLWGDPEVAELWATWNGSDSLPAEAVKRRIEDAVDRAVRERLGERARKEAYEALRPRYGVPHTPLEVWVAGLLGDERADASGLEWIAEDMEAWNDAVVESRRTAEYRIAFVLREPADPEVPGAAWLLEPGLQPEDAPGSFIPAEAVWSAPAADPVFRRRTYPAASARLAAGLASAAAVYPPLLRAAPAYAPKHCRLAPEEAAELLEHGAHELELKGFTVFLPDWWKQPAPIGVALRVTEPPANAGGAFPAAGDTAEPSPAARAHLGLSTLLSYRSELTIGGEAADERQLEAIVNASLPMQQHNGKWFRLTSKVKDAVRRFAAGNDRAGELSWAEMIHLALSQDMGEARTSNQTRGRSATSGDMPITGIFANERLESYIRSLQSLRTPDAGTETARDPVLPQPPELKGSLREYQRRGFTWLIRLRELGFGACLADDMGLGKTVQWIAYALYSRRTSPTTPATSATPSPLLLICPTSVLGNWERELERFAPSLSVHLHYGPQRAKGASFQAKAEAHDVVLTSYSTALRDRKSFAAVQWDAVTLDEAQYIKNAGTQLARFVRTLASAHRIAMTGTPIENRLSDLWSIFEWINPGYLGSERSFKSKYAVPIERHRNEATAEKLHKLIQPFVLRRVKTDPAVINDLPEKLELTSLCALTKTQAELYRSEVDRLARTLETASGMARRGAILSAITRLKQICNEPAHALKRPTIGKPDSGKLLRLTELLAESRESGERCVIFTQYAAMANLLKQYLERTRPERIEVITGRTPAKERERIVRSFQEEEDGPAVLVLSLKTGGFGLNLTRATRLIHYDRWWNPAAERQATDRIYRIGQKSDVEIWKLITKGTLEESIDRLLQEKERLSEGVVGSGERWLTEWNDDELKQLLTLRQEIVFEDETELGGTYAR